MADARARLIVFARPPRMGRGKRRLAADIGDVAAWSVYRRLLGSILLALRRDPRWRLELWLTQRGGAGIPYADGLDVHLQRGRDLGARMAHALSAGGAEPALLIGSDIADLGAADIAAALRALRGRQAVIGPAPDGGYWLIGASGPPYRRRPMLAPALSNVRWSSSHALEDTLRGLRGIAVGTAPEKRDIDTVDDLHRPDA